MMEQLCIPGLENPSGYVYERFITGEDPQTDTGRYAYWTLCFSLEKPIAGKGIRNIEPLFKRSA